ncbi:HK97 gp10 family phage protein [Streptomyces sp. NPDC051597]|uniref:HK97 gp10 family phage protein n=1 Tax=Streptomyces sp. NPDC051597 TaxID=3155049 RepID=UPI00341509D4
MAAKFKMSKRGVSELLNSPMIEAEVLRRAEIIKSVAESISPVGGPADPHPGLYKASWYAEVRRKPVGRSRKRRPVGVVGNRAYYARWVEYGNGGRVRAHHVLLRAAQAGGR